MGELLAYEKVGSGPPLLLLHGTLGSRAVWKPVLPALAEQRTLVLVDLPGMGDSAPIVDRHVPRDWIAAIDAVLADAAVTRPGVVGHSMGGWTALELAAAGRVAGTLALAPAGLWERSPRAADVSLRFGRFMSRVTPPALAARALAVPAVRRAAMRDLSVDAGEIPTEWAVSLGADGRRSTGFRDHFRAARADAFRSQITADVPVRVVFAAQDRIATPAQGQVVEALPPHAVIERWPDTGHMVLWDATDRVIAAALEVPTTPIG